MAGRSGRAWRKPAKASGASTSMLRFSPGLGRFFAAKFRAGVLYAIHERTGDRAALEEALKSYRAARAAWAGLAETAKGVYVPDITVGELPWLRGHWLDRLPAIDADIALLEKRLPSATTHQRSKSEGCHCRSHGPPATSFRRDAPSCTRPLSAQAAAGARTDGSRARLSAPPLPARQPGRALAVRRSWTARARPTSPPSRAHTPTRRTRSNTTSN